MLIPLASTSKISGIIFTCVMCYWFLHSLWTFRCTLKFTSLLSLDMFRECLWLIYLFDHIKYFQMYVFRFIRNRYWPNGYSIVLQLPSDMFILMINGQYWNSSKFKSTNVDLTMYGWLFMDTDFIALAAANDPAKHNTTSTRTVNTSLRNRDILAILQIFVNICNIANLVVYYRSQRKNCRSIHML